MGHTRSLLASITPPKDEQFSVALELNISAVLVTLPNRYFGDGSRVCKAYLYGPHKTRKYLGVAQY